MIDLDQAFQQVWDFRRKEDNDGDSMSEDSKPCSGLAPFLSSPDKDDEETTQQIGKAEANIKKSDKKSTKRNRVAKRKRKVELPLPPHDPDLLLSDFRKFTDSLVEEIKVERKKMFAQMKRQIARIVNAKPSPGPKRRKKVVPKTDTKAMHQESGKKSRRKTQTQTQTHTNKRKRSNAKLREPKKCSSNLPNDPGTNNACNADQKEGNSLADASTPLEESRLPKDSCKGTKGDFDMTGLFKCDVGSKDMVLMETQTSTIFQHWYSSNIAGKAIVPECFDPRSNMMSYNNNNGGRFASFGSGNAKTELHKQNVV